MINGQNCIDQTTLLNDTLQHVEVDKVGWMSINVHTSIIYKLICCEWIHGTGYWSIPISNLYKGILNLELMTRWCHSDVSTESTEMSRNHWLKCKTGSYRFFVGPTQKQHHFFGGNGRAYSDARWSNHWRFSAIDMFMISHL